MRTITVVPAYHDMENTSKVLKRFGSNTVDTICLVIDCATNEEIAELGKTARDSNIPLHIIANKERKGVGNAIREGIRYSIDNEYDVVVIMAGNNKDDPKEISRLLAPILKEGFDYVQGSRFLPGGKHTRNPFFRGAFSRIFPMFWSLLIGIRCTDVTNGFRAYRLCILSDKRINIWQDWLAGYQLEYYLHYKALTLGYRTKEVPVSKTYPYRHKGGYSHIRPLHDWWGIVGPLLYLRLGVRK